MSNDSLRVTFLGEICAPGECGAVFLEREEDALFAGIADSVGAGDLLVANVECCLSDRGEPLPAKYAVFKGATGLAAKLRRLDVALLANNHMGDFGGAAMSDTVRCLSEAGMTCVGYGRDLAEAVATSVVERHGFRVGFVGMSCCTTNGRNYAGPDSPGVAPLSLGLLEAELRRSRGNVDALFFCPHWGVEMCPYPVPEQMRAARRAIDWGADAVIGGHPHVIQARETYKRRPIFHSLGNLVFPRRSWDSTSREGSCDARAFEISQQARESLAACVELKRGPDGGVALRVAQVTPLRFGEDYVPRPVPVDSLAFHMEAVDRKTAAYARRSRRLLARGQELEYVARWTRAGVQYFYRSPPVGENRFRQFLAPLGRILRRAEGR